MLTTIGTLLGIIISLIVIYKYAAGRLGKFISECVEPLKDSLNNLKDSIDRLNQSTRDEFVIIYKRLDEDRSQLNEHDKQIAIHEQRLDKIDK